MKKLFITMMGLLVVIGCNQKPKSYSYDDEDEEDECEELKLKAYKFSETDGIAHVDVHVEYPVKGETKLVDAIRTYIANHVELESDEVELSDGQGVIDFYGRNLMTEMKSLAADYMDDDYVTEVYHDWTFTKLCETDLFVTFHSQSDIYEGGLHGVGYEEGISFFQDDGSQFTADMLRRTASPDFQKLVRQGLRAYFASDGQELTDEQLAEELIVVADVNDIPLPQADPYLSSDGVTFIYQPYEISYFAAGLPTFTIPMEQMKPFLTQKAIKKLWPDDEDDE